MLLQVSVQDIGQLPYFEGRLAGLCSTSALAACCCSTPCLTRRPWWSPASTRPAGFGEKSDFDASWRSPCSQASPTA